MTLVEALRGNLGGVEARWSDRILASYPTDGAKFYRASNDPFGNPVGAAVRRATASVLAWLVAEGTGAPSTSDLDDLIRIRSVQGFTPAQAAGVVFALKDAIAAELGDDLARFGAGDVVRLFARIDELALRAFDVYTESRERIAEIRVRETRARTYSLLRRAGVIETEEESNDRSTGDKGQGPARDGGRG
ncbi:MAG: RsbRD N-terminal domain-containing protein [Acidobacteriota bacterium]